MVEFHEVVGLSQHRNEVLVTQLCPALRPHQGNPSQHRVSNIMDEDFPEEKEDKTIPCQAALGRVGILQLLSLQVPCAGRWTWSPVQLLCDTKQDVGGPITATSSCRITEAT